MIGTLILQKLSAEHVAAHIDAYLAVSADVSPWRKENFLRDAPEKWDLSFALWEDVPVGYCILSRRNGVVHINQLMVAPYARGDGIGKTLLEEAERRGASSLKVDPLNTGAIRFYGRHGWREAGTENGYLLMRKTSHR
jgi:ribosomal protein S18 acetylase RimI-like enzyme